MGRHNLSGSYLYQLASQYTLHTNYFASSFGGPFLNHQTLVGTIKVLCNNSGTVCHNANSADWANSDVVFPTFSALDDNLASPKDSSFVGTTNGAAMTAQECYVNSQIHTVKFGKVPHLAPLITSTIGDRLTAAGASWVWYAEDLASELNQTSAVAHSTATTISRTRTIRSSRTSARRPSTLTTRTPTLHLHCFGQQHSAQRQLGAARSEQRFRHLRQQH